MRPRVPFTCRLSNRRILRVRGSDAHEFLQGIFTNDLRELHASGSMYGCFLYFTGRVMCDAHLHQCRRVHDGQASILVDVDASSVEELCDHLGEMKMRKKVVIDNVGEDLAVVASLEHSGELEGSTSSVQGVRSYGSVSTENASSSQTLEGQHTECFADARNAVLFPPPSKPKVPLETTSVSADGDGPTAAATAATPSSSSLSTSSQPWFLKRCVVPLTWAPPLAAMDPYFELLYSRGIGEGPSVFKNNKSLPFEGNLDFLQGVSFHKGCYVGQELTHRTHVMLVTRKRTVPLVFGAAAAAADDDGHHSHATPRLVDVGESLYSSEKEKIGEVTGVCGGVGVGLLRLRYVAKDSHTVPGLQLKDGTPVQMTLPDWWPRKEVKKLLKNNT
ncbi:hypothetical protein ABB37_05738 [Leptomonas pyrrhocoris]|uniref:CAF17 C-terminal domain-containing protein n=1 Tax=Leptomonas pyrrhocoris TaxID=157538 RepID=A0A0M9FZN8_LEPPY|nr:hypothetical protein ABB37_05738 [Leptomonas pyrrhocoris]KPA79263.1 hypothetical protein ABB37_05738 [Leptomonas pyrrhocoris]|eukprot:XP_015657702.1 hypothetical protein ABB37_05738 [Leptomonas pyrrhocoris]